MIVVCLLFQKCFLSVGLLGVFIALILIGGVIILIHHGGKYYYNEVNYKNIDGVN